MPDSISNIGRKSSNPYTNTLTYSADLCHNSLGSRFIIGLSGGSVRDDPERKLNFQ